MAGLQFYPTQLLADIDDWAEDSDEPDEEAEKALGLAVLLLAICFHDFPEDINDGNKEEYHAAK